MSQFSKIRWRGKHCWSGAQISFSHIAILSEEFKIEGFLQDL
jgi:hypothetical protein